MPVSVSVPHMKSMRDFADADRIFDEAEAEKAN
jgi:hypothetical protein